ncbi:MAG: aminotransferase class I/II-fold pyridoxal phosphate-dependent enzyme, partial [Paracoccaceae bacterium]
MKFSGMTERLADLGSAKWALHYKARAMKAAGEEILEFTIGEPDTPTPENLQRIAAEAIAAGRTGYSNGRGEPALLAALAGRYSDRLGRTIGKDQFLCLPGTQSALFVALMSITDPGDEVIV